MMTLKEIDLLIHEAVDALYQHQPNIFEFTVQTGQTEWNLAHHLANELHRLLPDYDCDVDVTKHEYGNMRPDIIFHKRGTNKHNLLVIETKFRRNQEDVESDIRKIRDEWFAGRLHYRFGASINLWDSNRNDIQTLQNE